MNKSCASLQVMNLASLPEQSFKCIDSSGGEVKALPTLFITCKCFFASLNTHVVFVNFYLSEYSIGFELMSKYCWSLALCVYPKVSKKLLVLQIDP